jgi:hypothetical protein
LGWFWLLPFVLAERVLRLSSSGLPFRKDPLVAVLVLFSVIRFSLDVELRSSVGIDSVSSLVGCGSRESVEDWIKVEE